MYSIFVLDLKLIRWDVEPGKAIPAEASAELGPLESRNQLQQV
jgi:hypothetical protein